MSDEIIRQSGAYFIKDCDCELRLRIAFATAFRNFQFHKAIAFASVANCIFVDSSSIFISVILNEFSVSQVNEHSHIRIIFGVLEMYFDELSTKMQFARLANAIAL